MEMKQGYSFFNVEKSKSQKGIVLVIMFLVVVGLAMSARVAYTAISEKVGHAGKYLVVIDPGHPGISVRPKKIDYQGIGNVVRKMLLR